MGEGKPIAPCRKVGEASSDRRGVSVGGGEGVKKARVINIPEENPKKTSRETIESREIQSRKKDQARGGEASQEYLGSLKGVPKKGINHVRAGEKKSWDRGIPHGEPRPAGNDKGRLKKGGTIEKARPK